MKVDEVAIADLSPDPANARAHSRKNLDAIKSSLKRFGQQKPIVIDADMVVVAGNGTLEAAKELGWDKIKAWKTTLKGADRIAFAIADNRTAELAEWDEDNLGKLLQGLREDGLDLAEIGFDLDDLEDFAVGEGSSDDKQAEARRSLSDRFGVPPFSVLDARQGYWQERKRVWLSLGIQSELGRGGAPGGSPRPAARLTDSGHTERGDGRCRKL